MLKAVMLVPVCVWAGSAFNFLLQVLNNQEVILRACRLCHHSGLDKTPPQAQETDTYLMRWKCADHSSTGELGHIFSGVPEVQVGESSNVFFQDFLYLLSFVMVLLTKSRVCI